MLGLSVEDTGCGFDLSPTALGQGLAMMTDYSQASGGKTEIIASPGE